MARSYLLCSVCCLLLLPASAWGQDPFADGNPREGSDPFGSGNPSPTRDPFGGGNSSASDDPFAANPFGNAPQGKKVTASQQGARIREVKKRIDAASSCARIRSALSDETSFTFIELPLSDAVQQIGETHDIPIVVDQRALEEVGLSSEEPVVLSLKNVSLRSALRLLLRELDLTYVVRSEVLQITTQEQAERMLDVRVYRLDESMTDKCDQVMTAMQATVQPDKWELTGGPCKVAAVGHVLVVAGTETLHEEVADFLQMLHAAFQ